METITKEQAFEILYKNHYRRLKVLGYNDHITIINNRMGFYSDEDGSFIRIFDYECLPLNGWFIIKGKVVIENFLMEYDFNNGLGLTELEYDKLSEFEGKEVRLTIEEL